jgi:hypothetical protein
MMYILFAPSLKNHTHVSTALDWMESYQHTTKVSITMSSYQQAFMVLN